MKARALNSEARRKGSKEKVSWRWREALQGPNRRSPQSEHQLSNFSSTLGLQSPPVLQLVAEAGAPETGPHAGSRSHGKETNKITTELVGAGLQTLLSSEDGGGERSKRPSGHRSRSGPGGGDAAITGLRRQGPQGGGGGTGRAPPRTGGKRGGGKTREWPSSIAALEARTLPCLQRAPGPHKRPLAS